MRLDFIKTLTVITLAVLMFSCGGEQKNTSNSFDDALKIDEGLIRGVNLNDTKEKVKTKEKANNLIEETEELLEYEFIEERKDTKINYVVAYNFDENGCFEIDVDVLVIGKDKKLITQEIMDSFKRAFTKKFGNPKQGDEMLIWNDSSKTTTVELDYINLEGGKIVLTIFANE